MLIIFQFLKKRHNLLFSRSIPAAHKGFLIISSRFITSNKTNSATLSVIFPWHIP